MQKGGIAGIPGCFEHTGIGTQLLRKAKESKGDLAVLWLDMANADGSIPHKLVELTLKKHHVPEKMTTLILDYYESFQIRISSGQVRSDGHRLEKGIITGCTISASLFTLATNMIAKSAEKECRGPITKSGIRPPPIRAYMDDLTVTTASVTGCDLERESSERYKGYVVRSRLKRVLNEAVKTNATVREEEVRRFPDRYSDSVKTPDGRLLRSSREMRYAFRAHFRDRFARCTDLPLRKFRSHLADFPRLEMAGAASCEGVVTECEVRDALKQVGLNKSPGLDGLPYEVYLRMSHMFVPILTDMFNHWFAQGAIPGSITKGVITLLKKGGRHVWEGLDDYRPITRS